MIQLTLDYSTWRCGLNGNTRLGKGDTALLNDEGYMCCLGQFSPQLNPEVTKEDMLNHTGPNSIRYGAIVVPGLTYLDIAKTAPFPVSTDLTYHALGINDDERTTVNEKIKLLKALFLKAGYEINVINQPMDKNAEGYGCSCGGGENNGHNWNCPWQEDTP